MPLPHSHIQRKLRAMPNDILLAKAVKLVGQKDELFLLVHDIQPATRNEMAIDIQQGIDKFQSGESIRKSDLAKIIEAAKQGRVYGESYD